MSKVKQKKVYTYDFPENREIAKGLHIGDMTIIARKTGFSNTLISEAFKGRRKMPPNAYLVAKQLIEFNQKKDAFVHTL